MSAIVPSSYSTQVRRGALGMEMWDVARGARAAHQVRVSRDAPQPAGEWLPSHQLYMHALFYTGAGGSLADLRILDDERIFVPRRLRFPIPLVVGADAKPPSHRVRRVGLYPGAAYPYPSGATGLRGRVLRNGVPVRWARVQAQLVSPATVIGNAHTDDRGEFLLFLSSAASLPAETLAPVTARVRITAAKVAPTPAEIEADPLAGLPLEVVGGPTGADDPVAMGSVVPASFTAHLNRVVTFHMGKVRVDEPPFVLS